MLEYFIFSEQGVVEIDVTQKPAAYLPSEVRHPIITLCDSGANWKSPTPCLTVGSTCFIVQATSPQYNDADSSSYWMDVWSPEEIGHLAYVFLFY